MKNITPEFAEILGLLCAEGSHIVSYSSYWGKDRGRDRFFKNDKSERVEFSNNDYKLLKHYKRLLFKEFNYAPNITKHNKVNICKISIINKIINETPIGHLKWRVPQSVLKSNNEVKSTFLRGFFDGDGTASKSIRFFSSNLHGLNQVSKLLNDIKIKHNPQGPEIKEGRKPSYILYIKERERERFLKTIRPISKRPDNF
jgi:intein/homing endonuclease|tara:strand:- start:2305 stop:2904 length:600 start_codon:yes stop_codon:yes gene_type:complete